MFALSPITVERHPALDIIMQIEELFERRGHEAYEGRRFKLGQLPASDQPPVFR